MTTLTLQTVGNYTWFLDYTLTQDAAANQSTVSYTLRAHRNVSSGSGAFWGTPARSFNVTLDGNSDTESFSSIDFTAAADIDFTSGTVVVDHNPDGTHSAVRVYASSSGSYVSSGFPVPATYGYATGHTGLTITLPKINRNILQVGDGGTWKLAEVHAGIDGDWVPAQPHAGDGGTWKELTT